MNRTPDLWICNPSLYRLSYASLTANGTPSVDIWETIQKIYSDKRHDRPWQRAPPVGRIIGYGGVTPVRTVRRRNGRDVPSDLVGSFVSRSAAAVGAVERWSEGIVLAPEFDAGHGTFRAAIVIVRCKILGRHRGQWRSSINPSRSAKSCHVLSSVSTRLHRNDLGT